MNPFLLFALLRMLADALRTGDAASAGERIHQELDGVVGGLRSLLRGCCGCGVAYLVLCLLGGVFYLICEGIGWLLGNR